MIIDTLYTKHDHSQVGICISVPWHWGLTLHFPCRPLQIILFIMPLGFFLCKYKCDGQIYIFDSKFALEKHLKKTPAQSYYSAAAGWCLDTFSIPNSTHHPQSYLLTQPLLCLRSLLTHSKMAVDLILLAGWISSICSSYPLSSSLRILVPQLCSWTCAHTRACVWRREITSSIDRAVLFFIFIFLLLHMSIVSNTSQWALKFPCFQGLTSVMLSVPCHRWKEYNYGFSVTIDFCAPNHSKKGHESTWLPLRRRICIWLFYLAEDTSN